MGAFADLFRTSPSRRQSSSPSSKQPQSLSTLDVPLPLPQPMWALATEPEYGRRPGPREMRSVGGGETGSSQTRTLKKVDRRGDSATTGVAAGRDRQLQGCTSTADFGMGGLSMSDSPGPPSTYPPRPANPSSVSYSTAPYYAVLPNNTYSPPAYPPSARHLPAGSSDAPLVPLNVAVHSHRSSLPFYTSASPSQPRSTPQSARTSPERPLPPTPPPCPPLPPALHTPPHHVNNSRPVRTPATTPSHTLSANRLTQTPPVVPPRPPRHPEQQLHPPSPTRLADRTNTAPPPKTSPSPRRRSPPRTSSSTAGKSKGNRAVVLDISSSSDDSFIDDSAISDDGENDSLLDELRESVFRGHGSSGKDPIKAATSRKTPVSTPSPRRRRQRGDSSTPRGLGRQRQCSGITSAGRRCTRSCSPSFGSHEDAGGEGEDVGFCNQHAKTAVKESGCFVARRGGKEEQWISFSGESRSSELGNAEPSLTNSYVHADWISESLPVETQALLRQYMTKPVSDKDEDGFVPFPPNHHADKLTQDLCCSYIYVHELVTSPHVATLPTAHLKLGRSIHPVLRLSQHRRTNTLCPLLGEPIVRYIFPAAAGGGGGGTGMAGHELRFAEQGAKNSHRWERLCLVELAGRALSARKEEGKCRECGKKHLECFEVQRGAVSAGGAAGSGWSVREVVERWERWCSDIIG